MHSAFSTAVFDPEAQISKKEHVMYWMDSHLWFGAWFLKQPLFRGRQEPIPKRALHGFATQPLSRAAVSPSWSGQIIGKDSLQYELYPHCGAMQNKPESVLFDWLIS